ncbi:cupin domain-containing protein [bacterium]|nr:cupin domain-containing protein [bacterium]
MSKEIYAIILAANSGEKLWPLTDKLNPLSTFTRQEEYEYTVLQKTFINLVDCVDDKNIVCTTDTKSREYIEKQLKEMQEKFCRTTEYKIIEEPVSMGTATAAALSVKYLSEKIAKEGEDATIILMPSDRLIKGNLKLDYFLEKGKQMAQEGYIVCLGTRPNRADTNLSYVTTRNDKKLAEISKRTLRVSKYITKPTTAEAKKLIKDKKIFADCGIYMFNASTFFSRLKTTSPQLFKALQEIEIRDTAPAVEYNIYEKLGEGKIEEELIEKASKMAVIPMNIEIEDCDTWAAAERLTPKDKQGNSFTGNCEDIESKNTFVFSSSRLVATAGLKDVYVIETPETVLVCNKEDISKTKELQKQIKKNKKTVANETVIKPWGYFTVLQKGEGYLTKMIYVNPHARLSLQTHDHRSEHWVVLSGQAKVIKGEEEIILKVSEGIDIKVKEPHSLQNPYDVPLKVLEVQTGELLSEDDIKRIEDIYGRVK